METNRIDYIDIAKGLGMQAIIWGHIMLFGWTYKMVYGFHIPLFFMLSGMCFNQKKYNSVWALIRRRVKTLLIPYMFFSLLTWLIYVIGVFLRHNDTLMNCWYYLFQTILAQGSGGYLEHNVALWFVPCLFVVDVIYYFISKLSDSLIIFFTLLIMVFGVMMSKHYYNITSLPWSIDSAFAAMPFYTFGNLVVKWVTHEKIIKSVDNNLFWSGLLTALLTVVLLYGVRDNGYVSMGHNTLGKHTWLFYFNAFCGSISTILFSLVLSSVRNRGSLQKVINYFRWLGNNSFYAMAIHLPLKACLLVIPASLLHTNTGKGLCSNIWISLMAYVATLFVTSLIIQFIIKVKHNYLIKKR